MGAIAVKQSSNDTTGKHKVKEQIPGTAGASIFSSPDTAIQRKPSCPCGGGCPRCRGVIQPKLIINQPGDIYEQEADRVAEQVLRMPDPSSVSQSPVNSLPKRLSIQNINHYPEKKIQRKKGDDEEEGIVQMKQGSPSYAAGSKSGVPPIVHEVLSSPGVPLDPATRTYMEPRFGHDFSRVRVHSDPVAEQSAREVNANAYTVGHNIVFDSVRFAPGTHEGRRLIAHELTHVVQQSDVNGIYAGQNKGKDGLFPINHLSKGALAVIQRDKAGGGSTEFEDQVKEIKHPKKGVVEGTVTRIETAPAKGSLPRQKVHEGTMNVRFDQSDCSVTIPYGYNFVQAPKAAFENICNDPPSTTAVPSLPANRINSLKTSVLADINRILNGWFDVRLSGSACPTGCADKTLPIHIVAREDTANPDTTITIVNRGGRANANTICSASWGTSTAVHEAGHQVLGVGDEYKEFDERLRAVVPEWFREERVRRDYSAMGPEAHTRFAMFHERHFNAVKTFLEGAFLGCTAVLHERKRRPVIDYRFTLGGGYALTNMGSRGFFEIGLGIGIPLDRLRRLQLVLGPQFNIIGSQFQKDFLLGVRLGLEGSTGEAGHGLTAGAFGETGGLFSSSDIRSSDAGSRSTKLYGELGLSAGYRTPLSDDFRFNLRIESAIGTAIESDPLRSRWFRLGLMIGAQF